MFIGGLEVGDHVFQGVSDLHEVGLAEVVELVQGKKQGKHEFHIKLRLWWNEIDNTLVGTDKFSEGIHKLYYFIIYHYHLLFIYFPIRHMNNA